MHRLGSRTHALIGLWILAGLAVMGVNGTMLMSLLDEPLAGYSSGVREADRGFRHYRMLLTAEAETITSGMDRLANRFASMVVPEEKPILQEALERAPTANKMESSPVALPVLTGIITSRSTDGTHRRLALMDGRIYAEGERVGAYTVKRVAGGGVSLVRGGQTLFLRAPEIAYSLSTQ